MIQPVNDLQRVQRFDDFDLTANRSGQWSKRQRYRFAAARLGEHLLGGLVFSLALAIIVNIFGLFGFVPELNLIETGVWAILVVTLIAWAIRLNAAFKKPIRIVDGVVSKRDYVPPIGYPLAMLTVGNQQFYVRPDLYQLLEEDSVYKVYYLERSPRAGGNLFLSVEAG